MKNVLMFAHNDPGQEGRLQVALDITRAVAGHLSCLSVIDLPVPLAFGDFTGAAAGQVLEAECQAEAANREILEAKLSREDVTWDFQEITGFVRESIEAAANLADIVILSSPSDSNDRSAIHDLAGNLVQSADCPVMAVPATAKGLDLFGTVLIAWDGSRRADNALQQAVPLLALAANVVVVNVDDKETAFAAMDAAEYLSRHGIKAEIEMARQEPGALVYTTIIERSRELGAAYVVMGAYGHAPAIEKVFGGVTRSMLAHCKVPLLLVH